MAESSPTTLGIEALGTAWLRFNELSSTATDPEIRDALRLAADIADSLSNLRSEVNEIIIKAAGDNFDIVDAVRELRRALEETAKAPASPVLVTTGDLLVTFAREGETEHIQVVENGEKALKVALLMLAMQDALRAGDRVTVTWRRRPTLIEQGLA